MMELSQDENKWLKYRWEFMRRDPCYRESYTTATEDIPREVNEETITRAEGAVEICHICGEYGLSKMIHPDLSFEELDEKDKESLALGGLGVCDEIDLGSRVLLEYNELVIYINFATINSLDALKKRINTLVDIKYKSYLEEHQRKFTELLVRIGKSETGKGHKKTLKLKDYKRILRIGDLRLEFSKSAIGSTTRQGIMGC